MSYAFRGSIPDADRSLQWTGGDGGIVPYWQQPLIFVEDNNPPEIPTAPTGTAIGVPETSYSFSTFAVDPDGDSVKYTLDWGDGTQSCTSLINSGGAASANHTWSKAGTYKIRAMATDSKGAFSEWSESLDITINTPPSIPKKPSGPISGRPGTSIN
ncbi:MAG: PKD domain-containing protein, partial [Methanothrix sp.]